VTIDYCDVISPYVYGRFITEKVQSWSTCRLTGTDTWPAVAAFRQLLMTPAAWLSFDGTRGAQPAYPDQRQPVRIACLSANIVKCPKRVQRRKKEPSIRSGMKSARINHALWAGDACDVLDKRVFPPPAAQRIIVSCSNQGSTILSASL